MAKIATKSAFTIGLLVLLLAVPAFASVNKSVKIGAGEESNGASSVNGSITVGDNAVVTGGIKTVNGSINVGNGAEIRNAATVNGKLRLGDGVSARDLSTVNGSVKAGRGASIDGTVETVNGSISLEEESSVSGDVGNVNGSIDLHGAEVGGDVSTTTGNIELTQTVVKGDVIVEEPSFWKRATSRKPRVVIGPGSRVEGKIVLEHEVRLYISESAEVGGVEGVMTMDDAKRFSGDEP
jgi:DUF4097 and DUF4098 domain-containing protein YvlB